MAVVMDQNEQQQQPYKHYCRICNKGFGCGRALGGHMRAHGITDEPTNHADTTDDDSPPACNDWDDDSNKPNTYKRMYALRANLNRRVCENCGKEFVSWKSFLAHGRCSSDVDSGEGDSMGSNGEEDLVGCAAWSKGKRSRRCRTSEEEDLANCLVMLSAARVEPILVAEAEESCASASRELDQDLNRLTPVSLGDKCKAPAAPAGVFECKACKKVFNSHQALGGHRASHKKVKGCFAAKLEDLEEAMARDEEVVITATNENNSNDTLAMAVVPLDQHGPLRKKSKVHECSICHRVFASGQALGGHKRCHWITSNAGDSKPHTTVPTSSQQLQLSPMSDSSKPLDLNVPASADETIGSPLRLEVPAAAYAQALVDQRNNINAIENSNQLTVDHDESYSKVKLAKLSELKDINMGGESSPWLQVGIGSSTTNEVSSDHQ